MTDSTQITNEKFAQEARVILNLALEYWAHRQQRYKNRCPLWVQGARELLTLSPAPAAPKDAPGEPALARACDLLSLTIGTLISYRAKIGYTDESPIARHVADAVAFLAPWPEKLPATSPAPEQSEDAQLFYATPTKREPLTDEQIFKSLPPAPEPTTRVVPRDSEPYPLWGARKMIGFAVEAVKRSHGIDTKEGE